MSISAETRNLIRQRAHFACEYCGIRETDVRGEFTLDHYQPKSKGGSDEIANLIYCCIWCNQHKLAYWPEKVDDVPLWNPRQSRSSEHFLLLEDGMLRPLSSIGEFTIQRLKLNDSSLVTYRIKNRYQYELTNQMTTYQDMIELQAKLIEQLTTLTNEMHALLQEQNELIRVLSNRRI